MKSIHICLTVAGVILYTEANAQTSFEAECLGNSTVMPMPEIFDLKSEKFGEYFKPSPILGMGGQIVSVKQGGKDMIFRHQYVVTRLRPEVRLGRTGLSLFARGGLKAYRPASYSDRTLKGRCRDGNSCYFRPSPSISVGIRYGF